MKISLLRFKDQSSQNSRRIPHSFLNGSDAFYCCLRSFIKGTGKVLISRKPCVALQNWNKRILAIGFFCLITQNALMLRRHYKSVFEKRPATRDVHLCRKALFQIFVLNWVKKDLGKSLKSLYKFVYLFGGYLLNRNNTMSRNRYNWPVITFSYGIKISHQFRKIIAASRFHLCTISHTSQMDAAEYLLLDLTEEVD